MDLAFRDREGRVVIVDWKTGRNEGRFSEVQLAGYALYAASRAGLQRRKMRRTELAYLVIPRFVRRMVDTRTLDQRARLHPEERRHHARAADRPLAEPRRASRLPRWSIRPQRCRRCNFRRLCFPRGVAGRSRSRRPSLRVLTATS
jgi:CRISPR/Cas system-associated exonuclease Cas4 (RecB family)